MVRDLHLYLGLFMSPFVLVFAVSVFFIVHSWLPKLGAESSKTRTVSALTLPTNVWTLSGRPLIDALKPVLEKAGAPGEIGFIERVATEGKLVIPVTVPGRKLTVTLSVTNSEAIIVTEELGLASALVTLHTSPGEHAPAIRMNWVFIQAWRWLSDATAYLTLFISISGVYLWYALRAERKVGFILLAV